VLTQLPADRRSQQQDICCPQRLCQGCAVPPRLPARRVGQQHLCLSEGTWQVQGEMPRKQTLALFTALASVEKGRGKLLLCPSVKLHYWETRGISRPPRGPGSFSELPGGTLAKCISWSRLMCTEKQGTGSRRLYFRAVVQAKDLTFPSIQ